jgi:hypothetical protein
LINQTLNQAPDCNFRLAGKDAGFFDGDNIDA